MKTVRRRNDFGKRQSEENRAKERRRLAQLAISGLLFLVVFLGRSGFPEQLTQWDARLKANTDFAYLFRQLKEEYTALSRYTARIPGEPEANDQHISEQASLTETQLESVTLLGNTDQRGMAYLSKNGFRQRNEDLMDTEDAHEIEIVTAVAQTFAEDGTKLPSNVSFAFYELGLDHITVPVIGQTSSGFGYRTSPINGAREFHLALDIVAEKGTEINAFSDGVVAYIGESDEFGLYFKIDHANGVSTFYAHCSKLLVRKGDHVVNGQTVALVGDTGNVTGAHLHFTIEKDNIRLDPAYYVSGK